VNSHRRDERGDGESREYEQAHGRLHLWLIGVNLTWSGSLWIVCGCASGWRFASCKEDAGSAGHRAGTLTPDWRARYCP
jgi:hypothetical protein